MAKPIYYLFQHKDTDLEELENEKQKYSNAGFMVAIVDDSEATEEGTINMFVHLAKRCGYEIPYEYVKEYLEKCKKEKLAQLDKN